MASRATILTSMLAVGAAPAMALIATNGAIAAQPNASPQINICHATSSNTNPFNQSTVDASSLLLDSNRYLGGHGDHANDIIPPFTHDGASFAGQNYTGTFAAIWANNCEALPTTSPSPSTSVTATASSSATSSSSASATSETSPSPSVSQSPSPSASQSQTSPPAPEPTPTVTQTVVVAVPGGVQIVEASVAPSPEVTTQDSVVPPLGATVPEDAFSEMELAEEGVIVPLAATVPEFVNAGGGSAGQNGEGPTGAIGLIVLSAIAGAGAVIRLARQ